MEYRVLGPLEVLDGSEPVPITAPKTRRLLLCLLIHPNETVSNERLVDAVWGGRPPASARKLVQVYVSELRRALGDTAIETVPGGYLLRTEPSSIDCHRFERLLDEGTAARAADNAELAAALFRRALALWRGPALADVVYEEFAAVESQRLEDRRLECIDERLAADLDAGLHENVVAELAALAAASPWRERTRSLLMLALYRGGRQAEALHEYRDLRHRLRDELGLEPGAPIRQLERAILEHDRSIAAPEPTARRAVLLPVPPTPLIGRRDELRQLEALVRRDDIRLISLTGAGGSGKTRLALALAEVCQHEFANGAALVELAPLRDPELVPQIVARALGVAEEPGEPLVETLAGWLSQRELLLIVDNVEHLVTAGRALAGLVAAAPRLTLVATSRRVLHLAGEQVFPIGPLRVEDGIELFAARAGAVRPAFMLTPEGASDVAEICRKLDGLPLAIELAAARSTMLLPRELLERLGGLLTALAPGPRDLPARQQTLRDTLDWSTQLLDPEERSTLARLTVFSGGCTLSSAESVCDADLNRLSSLVDHSLLIRTDIEGEPRFALLETIREYASELLDTQRSTFEERHASHFRDLAEAAELRGQGPEQAQWLRRLDLEQDNLRRALESAASSGDAETELRLGAALWRYWWLRGLLSEGRTRLATALERGLEAEPAVRAPALHGAAGLAWSQGDLDHARQLAEQALDAARAAEDLVTQLFAHTVLGVVAKDAMEFDRARYHLGESAVISARLGRPGDEVVAKLNLAGVLLDERDHEAAVTLLEDVLSYHESHGSTEGEGFALLNLGLGTFRLGRVEDARTYFERARVAFDSVGFMTHVASSLQGLAAIEATSGDPSEAARLLARADMLLGETGATRSSFDAALVTETEEQAREKLGDGYDAAYAAGRHTS